MPEDPLLYLFQSTDASKKKIKSIQIYYVIILALFLIVGPLLLILKEATLENYVLLSLSVVVLLYFFFRKSYIELIKKFTVFIIHENHMVVKGQVYNYDRIVKIRFYKFELADDSNHLIQIDSSEHDQVEILSEGLTVTKNTLYEIFRKKIDESKIFIDYPS